MTKLGNSKAVRKGGRYGRVMGTLWRHEKREKCGRAAMGLLLDVWSWCADQGKEVVSEMAMRKLTAGDANARRLIKELVSAGFLDQVPDGYAPHDWKDHSGYLRDEPTPPSGRDADATSDQTCDSTCDQTCDESATRPVMNAGSEIIQESHSSRTRARSPVLQFSSSPEEEREHSPPVVRMVWPKAANDQEHSASLVLVRQFHAHLMSTVASFPNRSKTTLDAYAKLAEWADGTPDPERTLRAAFIGFSEEVWAQKAGYPVADLAERSDIYLGKGIPMLDALEAQRRQEASQ